MSYRFNHQNKTSDSKCKLHNFGRSEHNFIVYRTLSEDKRCFKMNFTYTNDSRKRIALTSVPGSGNTWTRYLIERTTGIFTGSVYGDRSLMRGGLYSVILF